MNEYHQKLRRSLVLFLCFFFKNFFFFLETCCFGKETTSFFVLKKIGFRKHTFRNSFLNNLTKYVFFVSVRKKKQKNYQTAPKIHKALKLKICRTGDYSFTIQCVSYSASYQVNWPRDYRLTRQVSKLLYIHFHYKYMHYNM